MPAADAASSPSLAGFTLYDLARFKAHGFLPGASPHVRFFHSGRDDVRGVVLDLIGRARHSLRITMYGYDDAAINDAVLAKIEDPGVTVTLTLDKSQAAGPHEKRLLDLDRARLGADFNSHIAIGQSEFGHQILHTKGFVVDGVVMVEGSVNWSDSGEGAFLHDARLPHRAQANTMSVCTCPAAIAEFIGVLDRQFRVCQQQMAKTESGQIGYASPVSR